MGMLVCNGAMCMCTFGAAPGTLNVVPSKMVNGCNQPAANIMDNIVTPFGMCSSMSNPAVASATAAAAGVLTPQPCSAVIAGPWSPGSSTVMIKNQPALNNSSKLMCAFGGSISISNPGQTTIQVP